MPFMLRADTFRLMPEDVRLVHCHFPVQQYPVILDRKAAFVLAVDHSVQLWRSDLYVLERYASDVVRGGLDHTVVVVEREFILEPVAQCALVKWHVALEQLEVQWGEEAITEGISDGLVSGNACMSVSTTDSNSRRVSVIRGIDPLIMTICSLWGCLPEINVAVKDIRVVDGHHFVTANFDGQLLHDGAAQILNHGPVGIFTVQRDREGQPRGPGYNHVMGDKGGEPDKQLLVLVDAARIVGDDHRLPHSFDT